MLEQSEHAIADLESQGWEVLQRKFVKVFMEDVRKVELVVRKGNHVALIRHNRSWRKDWKDAGCFGYWHEKLSDSGGWGMWYNADL